MRNNPNFYLDALGIQTWKARAAVPGAKKQHVPFAVYQLLRQENAVGYLLLTQEVDGQSQEVEQLLQAIITALKLTMRPVSVAVDFTSLQEEKFILLMGLATAQICLAQSCDNLEKLRGQWLHDKNFSLPVIITEHPLLLISQPQLKRQVWQDLQLIVNLLG